MDFGVLQPQNTARRTCNLIFLYIVTIEAHCFRKNAAAHTSALASLKVRPISLRPKPRKFGKLKKEARQISPSGFETILGGELHEHDHNLTKEHHSI